MRAFISLILMCIMCAVPAEPQYATAISTQGERLAHTWLVPTRGDSLPMRLFDPPATGWGAGHRGIDFVAHPKQPIVAPTAGLVTFVGQVADRSVITIQVHGELLLSLEPIESDVQVGEWVSRGAHIGEVSSGGHCANLCVHLGVRHNGDYLNPLRFYVDKPRLLPTRDGG